MNASCRMRRRVQRDVLRWRLSAAVMSALILVLLVAPSGALAWTWPADGPVLRPFSVGPDPYAAGQHRGIDISAELGRVVLRRPAALSRSSASFRAAAARSRSPPTTAMSVTLLQLGATTVVRDSTIAEGAEVGVVGESADAVTSQPHVHLGIRVASDPDGYSTRSGCCRYGSRRAPPPAVVAPPAPVEAPPVAAPLTAAPPAEVVEPEAVAEPVSEPRGEPPRASRPHATAGAPAGNPSARPVTVEPRATRPSSRYPGMSRAALPTKASGSVAVKTRRR